MTSLINFLVEPFTYGFMLRALAAVILVSSVCSVVGTYIVLKGMAFFGDALAHAILPGIALGYLVSGSSREPLFWWAMVTAIISSIGISAISRTTRIKEDTAIGIIFAGMFALGIALISTVRNYAVDLTHFLFGNVLGVSNTDLVKTALFGGLIVLIVFLFYKEFLVLSFDPILAITLRLPARVLDLLLLVLVAVAIVVSLQTVGVALMVAMLITPAATAYLLTRRLPTLMGLAMAISAASSVLGLYLSYYLGIASGPAIVLTCTVVFLGTWMIQSISRRRRVSQ
jgi:manganese/iron transport system permease protein